MLSRIRHLLRSAPSTIRSVTTSRRSWAKGIWGPSSKPSIIITETLSPSNVFKARNRNAAVSHVISVLVYRDRVKGRGRTLPFSPYPCPVRAGFPECLWPISLSLPKATGNLFGKRLALSTSVRLRRRAHLAPVA